MADAYPHNRATANASPAPRRLPAPPTAPPMSTESRRSSRPLPKIPRALVCKNCGTYITSHNALLPTSEIPPDSRSFRGFAGKASLFTETFNVTLGKPSIQLMATGAHTMQEICCAGCSAYVGWKILRAHDQSESWKDGHHLLELENLYVSVDVVPLVIPTKRQSSGSLESDN